ncbi:MAG: MopE-related protein [Gammaproteobacteria bacterium]|nr:MopE-related protein [Gammaproteobacteria bacterium]MDH5802864.1 MopE-related protein [Gammaproteobacteria bacterium]
MSVCKYVGAAYLAVGLLMFVSTQGVLASASVGQVKGVVNHCNAAGVEGMQIYIAGRNHVLFTGADGKFLFERVSPGEVELVYTVGGKIVNRNRVTVLADETQDLGQIVFCSRESAPSEATLADHDKDGVSAPQDCDDNNKAVRPGAVELCDGIDNNCNGQVDENVALHKVDNGLAQCRSGKLELQSCQKGYADCDGQIANGCEIDTMVDADNCGACDNFCGGEICAAGSC